MVHKFCEPSAVFQPLFIVAFYQSRMYIHGNSVVNDAGFDKMHNKVAKISMDETVQKSCWGVTLWAVIGLATIILMAYLFSV